MKMKKTSQNPAIQEKYLGKPALIITPKKNESLFRWIKSSGLFMSSYSERFHDNMMTNKLENILDTGEELDEE